MAHVEKILTLQRAREWSAADDELIRPALQHANPSEIRFQVEHEGAELWHVEHESEVIAAYVLRVDVGPEGAEGVIVAAGGALAGIDLTAQVLPVIEGMFQGCRAVRIHTARPGMAKKLARQGYQLRELVFSKRVPNGVE